jgi:hypothetical protein
MVQDDVGDLSPRPSRKISGLSCCRLPAIAAPSDPAWSRPVASRPVPIRVPMPAKLLVQRPSPLSLILRPAAIEVFWSLP